MTTCPPIPDPLEAYAAQFDDLFCRANQRDGFRQYLAGLLLPAERNKTLTALANMEPVVGAQHAAAQRLQWFLSESTWDAAAVTARRLALLRADAATAPHAGGVLIIDETGDRKDGAKTAHVGRQYLGNRGKTEQGVVSVGSLWADEGVYYPLAVEPYTPNTGSRWARPIPPSAPSRRWRWRWSTRRGRRTGRCGAVVADSLYGEHAGFTSGVTQRGVPYVVALKPSHSWWAPIDAIHTVQEVAAQAAWDSPAQPGAWQPITRHYRDGHSETWWALEGVAGPYGPRARHAGWSSPPPIRPHCRSRPPGIWPPRCPLAAADLAEVVRLYGLRNWVEQQYKQVKTSLGWSQYQVRADTAMRRHWALVQCAFAFCWWAETHAPPLAPPLAAGQREPRRRPARRLARGGKRWRSGMPPWPRPWRCWPVALRRVRAWLEPAWFLWRCWRAWSDQPLPPPLQALFDWLRQGHPAHAP